MAALAHRLSCPITVERHLAGYELHGGVSVVHQIDNGAQLSTTDATVRTAMLTGEGQGPVRIRRLWMSNNWLGLGQETFLHNLWVVDMYRIGFSKGDERKVHIILDVRVEGVHLILHEPDGIRT